MKRFAALVIMLTVIPILAAAQAQPGQAAQATGPQPSADFEQKVKDFGTVSKGEKLKAVFMVKNSGDAPLEITQVRPTCGCTVANYDKTIPAGGSGKVEAEVDTAGFNGPITKAVLVYTNDPENQQINLVVKADVRAYIDVMPRSLLRFNVLQGESATEKVVLVPSEDIAYKVTGVDTAGGPYEVAFRELGEKERVPDHKGSQWEVAVTVPASAKEGMLTHKLVVKTTAPKAPELYLNVSGVVRPIVQVIPAEINFGAIPGDAPIGRNVILVNNRQGAELQLSDVKVDDPNFSTEVMPQLAGQRFMVTVTMKAGASKGAHKAVLKIATNDPARKLIEVPVQAIVQ